MLFLPLFLSFIRLRSSDINPTNRTSSNVIIRILYSTLFLLQRIPRVFNLSFSFTAHFHHTFSLLLLLLFLPPPSFFYTQNKSAIFFSFAALIGLCFHLAASQKHKIYARAHKRTPTCGSGWREAERERKVTSELAIK